jgi:hypothetical protein
MKVLMRMVLLGCVVAGSGIGIGQTVPPVPVAPTTPAAAPAPADSAKQIAAMEKKLADWPQLERYRADNAALAPVESGGSGWYFMGTRLRMGGDGDQIQESFFRGSRM